MTVFMDTLKARLADSQRRHQEATQALQRAQNYHQILTQEVFGWQKSIEAEARREAQEEAEAAALKQQTTGYVEISPNAVIRLIGTRPDADKAEFNKTEAIRELLRQHPAGMTPADVWDALKDQLGNRDYVYSVLKRLKDNNQAVERRGKYHLRETPRTEGKDQEVGVQ